MSHSIESAINLLNAEKIGDRYRYYADETSSYWTASEADMVELSRRIEAGGQGIYSEWCCDSHLVECDAA